MPKKALPKSLMYLILNKALPWRKHRYTKVVKLEEVGLVKRYHLKLDLFSSPWFFNWYCRSVCRPMNRAEIKIIFKKKIKINMTVCHVNIAIKKLSIIYLFHQVSYLLNKYFVCFQQVQLRRPLLACWIYIFKKLK